MRRFFDVDLRFRDDSCFVSSLSYVNTIIVIDSSWRARASRDEG